GFASAIAVSGNTLYVTGGFSSSNAGVGGLGTLGSLGGLDAFIMALDIATGAPVAGFGKGGVQTFGGTLDDMGSGVSLLNGTIYLCGTFSSLDAGIGGLGTAAHSVSNPAVADTFIAALDALTGA